MNFCILYPELWYQMTTSYSLLALLRAYNLELTFFLIQTFYRLF